MYGNDVVIVVTSDYEDKVLEHLKINECTPTKVVNYNCHAVFVFEGIRWSESYNWCKSILDYLRQIDEDLWGLVRVGESDGDIEILGCPANFDVYLNTTIEY